MYKLFVLSCFVAVALAKPGYLEHVEHGLKTVSVHSEIPVVKTKLIHEPATVAVQEHTIARVGEHVETIPTAVSHQSQTIVHSQADKITPILAPAVKTHYAPAVRTVEKQFIEKVPIVESYVAPTVVKSYAAPAIVKSYAAPALVKSYAAPALVKSYAAPTLLRSYDAPLAYAGYAAPYATSYAAPYATSYAAPYAAHHGLYRSDLPIVSQW